VALVMIDPFVAGVLIYEISNKKRYQKITRPAGYG